jgi:hypothetical protein
MKPNCHNRPDFSDTVRHQTGWMDIHLEDDYDGCAMIKTRVPMMETRPAVMSRNCQQHGPFGAATMYGWDCSGCRHKPEGE